jgi:hypothetical protein
MSYNPNATSSKLEISGTTSGAVSQFASAVTSSYSIIWPSAQGSASTVLTNDGAGLLSWQAPASTGVTNFAFTNGGGFTGNVTTSTTTPTLSLIGTLTGDITGSLNATALTATTNSTLTTLSALSLPYSQLTGTPSFTLINIPNTISPTNGVIEQASSAIYHNFGGNGNIFFGLGSGNFTLTSAFFNTATGFDTLQDLTTGQYNTALGYQTMTNDTSGSFNVGLGTQALFNNQTGNNNVAAGVNSAFSLNGGSGNTAIGNMSMYFATTGSNNVVIGNNAGSAIVIGSGNTFIGEGSNATGDFSNASAIGFGATVGASNSMVLGNASVKVGIGTSTPGTALDVVGTARTTAFNLSTSPTSGYVLTSDSSGNGTWQASAISGITQLTGDGTAGPGSGSQVLTLSTVNPNVGSFGSASSVATFTVNGKGLITAAGSTAISISGSVVSGGTFGAVNGSALTNLSAANLSGALPVGVTGGSGLSIASTQLTGTLQATQFPALTGDVTTTAGSLTTSLVATTNSTLTTLSALSLPYSQITGTPTPLVFADSLVNTSGTVTLVGDTATPGASQYYGTNASSVRGYYNLPSPTFSGLNTDGVIYATSPTTVASTTVGTAGQVLTSNGTGIAPTFQPSGSSVTLTSLGIRAGKMAISSGNISQAVTFSTTLGTTGYAISAILLNTTDTNPQMQAITITAQSATGFTASWSDPTLTANYVLSWTAILNN